MGKFISYNGNVLPKSQAKIAASNRGTLYGDGVFETMRCKGIIPPFYDLHWQRLQAGLSFLKMDFREVFSKQSLLVAIQQLLHKEKMYTACSVRVNCFRKEGGKYTPTNHGVEFFIEAFPLKTETYQLNSKGLKVGIFETVPKPASLLSNLKHSNALPLILAGIHKTERKWDDCILLNEKESLVEAVASNVYIKIGNKLVTPSLATGCVNGTIRKLMPQLAAQAELEYMEEDFIHPDILNHAEEVFFSNAIAGIQWAVAYNKRRYFYQTAQQLTTLLNAVFEQEHVRMSAL